MLNFNLERTGSTGALQLNILCGFIAFSGVLAFFAGRKIFTAFMGVLYILDLLTFIYYIGKMTGNGLEDFALGIHSGIILFINLLLFAAAILLDRAIPLEEPGDKII
ncbi:hypothetical protein [Paenibacillus sp. MMS20-IR301]|uniref:hypothetical protein n=1 Tax=Paenibacillus sp. MMS20-IR301 TaxID=2895946 RepID=UPI0028E2A70A|nr:hypothetical protein [Paenibacillus sp. MMS20-IR301]WNS44446.1 hypothetical protein LOS79_04015 [Paenibacillus sp. MMS20-IR301]